MPTEAAAALGFVAGAVAALIFTPIAISIAHRTDFQDRPREYRQHAVPTPFLGGAAVVAAFFVATIAARTAVASSTAVLLLCTLGMWAIGTLDDRYAVAPKWRVLAEGGAAAALVAAGGGWHLPAGGTPDFALSVVWVIGLVNAFNLMDNLDGACGTVGAVSALGIGTLAAIEGDPTHAGMAFGLAGACAGFLRFNLAKPARIFLGDGGSMPIGFLVAALAMGTSRSLTIGNPAFLALALMAGVVILDTTLVSVSRSRRGVSLLTGGRDHLTHRLLRRVGTPRAVATALAMTQALLCGIAIAGVELGSLAVEMVTVGLLLSGVLAIAVLDSPSWRPSDIAVAEAPVRPVRAKDQLFT